MTLKDCLEYFPYFCRRKLSKKWKHEIVKNIINTLQRLNQSYPNFVIFITPFKIRSLQHHDLLSVTDSCKICIGNFDATTNLSLCNLFVYGKNFTKERSWRNISGREMVKVFQSSFLMRRFITLLNTQEEGTDNFQNRWGGTRSRSETAFKSCLTCEDCCLRVNKFSRNKVRNFLYRS